jgi:hypothetical protein
VANLPLVSTTQAAKKLPPVSATLAEFATGINDTGGNLPPFSLVLLKPVANCHRYQRQWRQIATGVNNTCGEQWEQLSDC